LKHWHWHWGYSATGVILILVLAACGGSDEQIATEGLTKAQFLKRGNAICAAATARINKNFEKYSSRHLSKGRTVSEVSYARAMGRIVIPHVEAEVKRIRGLGAPTGDEERVNKILAAFENGIREGKMDPQTLPGNHGTYAFREAHTLALHYGLERCALA